MGRRVGLLARLVLDELSLTSAAVLGWTTSHPADCQCVTADAGTVAVPVMPG